VAFRFRSSTVVPVGRRYVIESVMPFQPLVLA
jgi:hypothetical protein